MAKQKKSQKLPEQSQDDLEEIAPVIEIPPQEMKEWNGIQIAALPKVFFHTKIMRTLAWRSENVAVYNIHSFYEPEKITGYEVFRIMKMPARSIMGKLYPPAEKAPGDEKWGIYGFDCGTLESAMKIYVPILEALKYNGPKWK